MALELLSQHDNFNVELAKCKAKLTKYQGMVFFVAEF